MVLVNATTNQKIIAWVRDFQKNYGIIGPYLMRYWRSYIGLTAGMVLGIFTTLFFAWFIKDLTESALQHNMHRINMLIVMGIIVLISNSLMTYGFSYLRTATAERVSRDLSVDLYKAILHLPAPSLNAYNSGDLLARLTNDIETVVGAMGMNIMNLIRIPLTVIAAFLYLFSINSELAIVCVCCGPVFLVGGLIVGKLLRSNGRKIQEYYGKVYGFLNDSLSGFTVVRSFTLESVFLQKYFNHRKKLLDLELQEVKLKGGFRVLSQIGGSLALFVCYGLGARFVSDGSMSVGSMMAFVTLVQNLVFPFRRLANHLGSIQRSFASAERILKVLHEPKEEDFDLPDYSPPFLPSSLRFEKVNFQYDDNRTVIQDFTLHVPNGKLVAIVGPTGAGKTTIFNLVMRLYSPTSGQIYLDDQPIQDMPIPRLRRLIAYVPQDTYIFTGTIRENLLYGNPTATGAQLIQAARDANIHDFIISLQDGYETQLGEKGLRLSGGQKQRLAIARALLKEAPVLLLDEATSALDLETEALVRDAIEGVAQRCTTVVIAHRLSTIRNADLIVVIRNGEIVEQGTHEELLDLNGAYSRLYRTQFEDEEIKMEVSL